MKAETKTVQHIYLTLTSEEAEALMWIMARNVSVPQQLATTHELSQTQICKFMGSVHQALETAGVDAESYMFRENK